MNTFIIFTIADVIRAITSRRGRWDVHVARMVWFRGTCEVLAGKLGRGGRDHLVKIGVERREGNFITIRWTFSFSSSIPLHDVS
jgi:hypothetical protein